ncbi:hypothetical protein [Brevifollis gellanilyticus]|uniref:Uncharacterized protein n=1 Tax=Brevifollis gellanilyticus TaxID=748831 RepID=A0A512MBV2_9BACT|nr:hypothetical protein [Brevifollis gellanilyticus]GEP44204.1 hypothetical protein BGE01nite_34950 [Brevifollis gellanilyticus]
MDRLLHLFREYPAVAGVAFFILISLILISAFASMMTKAGVSLKPIIFVFGFIAIVGVPQGVVHLLDAFAHYRASKQVAPAPAPSAEKPQSSAPAASPVPWEKVFGPDVDPHLIVDAKIGLKDIVNEAEEAQVAFKANGETTLVARFASSEAARQGLERYRDFFKLTQEAGDEVSGLTGKRYQGGSDWSHVVVQSNELYAWTGATREIVEAKRLSALGTPADTSGGGGSNGSGISKRMVSTRLAQNVPVMITFMVINLILAVGWFFKASAWAARVPAVAVSHPLDATTLRSHLMAIGSDSTPMEVKSNSDGSLEVMWRYADARWLSVMSAHHLKRAHKLVLYFDPDARMVRVCEYWSAFDGSVSPNGANLAWRMNMGIQFFAVEHERVIGVQLDKDGTPSGELTKAWTFDLQQLKAPFITAITEAGWMWQPLTWRAPAGLRWLTE